MGIDLKGVTKRFGQQSAVDGIWCSIAPREFFAIVGASGCGKSTLLRLIAGLDTLSEGEILLAGTPVSGDDLHVPPEARNVGFVFQSYALWPHLDVRGNVAFPAEMAGLSRAEAGARADEHLKTVDLSAFSDRKPADLSGGQRQRVALARCLAQGAKTILMDEPLANLDPHLRAAMERELVAFHQASEATTVYITHDQREAMAVADRMAVMARGRFLQVGTPTEIYERPASAEVARFIGAGSIQPIEVSGSKAHLAGREVPVSGLNAADTADALFRPEEISLGDPGSGHFDGRVAHVLYRGGAWEAQVEVDGLNAPFEVHSRRPLSVDETLSLWIDGGWCLPA